MCRYEQAHPVRKGRRSAAGESAEKIKPFVNNLSHELTVLKFVYVKQVSVGEMQALRIKSFKPRATRTPHITCDVTRCSRAASRSALCSCTALRIVGMRESLKHPTANHEHSASITGASSYPESAAPGSACLHLVRAMRPSRPESCLSVVCSYEYRSAYATHRCYLDAYGPLRASGIIFHCAQEIYSPPSQPRLALLCCTEIAATR